MKAIHDTLDQIHTHLGQTEQVDPALRKEFHELDTNIRKMLAVKNDNAATELNELDKQARLLAARFETKHPHVGGLITQLANILQSMGM